MTTTDDKPMEYGTRITPLLAQYFGVREQYPGFVILFRLGTFIPCGITNS